MSLGDEPPAPTCLGRRGFLLGSAAALATLGADLAGPGPALYSVPGEGPATGFSSFARHRIAGTAAGLDFAVGPADPVHPVARGVVAVATEDRVSGVYVILDHGFYQTRYAHLASASVRVGERVERARPIAVAGATGLGAAAGPHLHLDLHADVLLAAYRPTPPSENPLVWLDPVGFAARSASDPWGNATLPWPEPEDRELDDAHDRAWRAAVVALRPHLARLPRGATPDGGPAAVGMPEGAPGAARRFRARLRQLHAAVAAGQAPEAEAPLRALLAVQPRLSAPLRRSDGALRPPGRRG